VLRFGYNMIDKDMVQALGSNIEGDHDAELSPVSNVDASGSESGE
jgi:hypothetical protein